MCRGLLVDTGSNDDQPVCIDGSADIADFEVLHVYTTAVRAIINAAKRNRFDNFTGNSLSHLITPTIIIIADSRGEIKTNPAGLMGRQDYCCAWGNTVCDKTILLDTR